ncbi:hypothetical protein WAE61_20455, partial [Comamonadaceae bacterium PP-2]
RGFKVLGVVFDMHGLGVLAPPPPPHDIAAALSNQTTAAVELGAAEGEPCVATIYQLDGIVRRAPALQLTADARQGQAWTDQTGDHAHTHAQEVVA